mmetsp:Transcript_100299/g.321636  ORF Transcript_100299/g.321636 Transcript_100299/m.321636 type:complete len:315 (-) Transcript_100299:291-1235(-)
MPHREADPAQCVQQGDSSLHQQVCRAEPREHLVRLFSKLDNDVACLHAGDLIGFARKSEALVVWTIRRNIHLQLHLVLDDTVARAISAQSSWWDHDSLALASSASLLALHYEAGCHLVLRKNRAAAVASTALFQASGTAALAACAHNVLLVPDLARTTLVELLQRHFHGVAHVWGAPPTAGESEVGAEHLPEDVEGVGTRAEASHSCTACVVAIEGRLTPGVVDAALLWVREHFVGLGDGLEALLGRLLLTLGCLVRVVFESRPLVCLFDLLRTGASIHAQEVIVRGISCRHRRTRQAEAKPQQQPEAQPVKPQ